MHEIVNRRAFAEELRFDFTAKSASGRICRIRYSTVLLAPTGIVDFKNYDSETAHFACDLTSGLKYATEIRRSIAAPSRVPTAINTTSDSRMAGPNSVVNDSRPARTLRSTRRADPGS
jgi:hypothetical protein